MLALQGSSDLSNLYEYTFMNHPHVFACWRSDARYSKTATHNRTSPLLLGGVKILVEPAP